MVVSPYARRWAFDACQWSISVNIFVTSTIALDPNSAYPMAEMIGMFITSCLVYPLCYHTFREVMGMGKTVALEWNAFFKGEVRPKQQAALLAIPAAAAGALAITGINGMTLAHAGILTMKMAHAFSPLIGMMQGLSYPVSFLGMAAGMLLISVGQRHRGINMIKWAAIGYIGMQLVPGIMQMVSQVGDSMK